MEEAFRNIEAPDVLEVVQQPVGDAHLDPALRVHQRVGAEPLDRDACDGARPRSDVAGCGEGGVIPFVQISSTVTMSAVRS